MTTIDNNIQETRVSFPVAKLLKEAGFDCLYCKYWNCSHITDDDSKTLSMFKNEHVDSVKAPTQQLAIDWIRVNFGIVIYTYSVAPYIAEDEDYPKIVWVSKVQKYFEFDRFIDTANGLAINHFNTPIEAKEAALEYVLTNLILKK